jgi:hypothetical protein
VSSTLVRTIHWVNMRNPHCEQMISALLPTPGDVGRLRIVPRQPTRRPTRVPVLRRSHEHHRDLQPRLDTAIQTAAANRDQDRYVMITFPTSQILNPVLPRRPSIRHGGARANMPLPRQRRHRSSWLTADSRTPDGPIMRRNLVSQHTHRRRLPSLTSVVRKPP